ncbi:LysR family transcriptional regulator ArgP [Pistricoccus aurantiacus]|uniref:LysR family transcriptional regulator ArgP n=1 Tax=Pistricoccus aurantiacus TaxID=1883414 RepID=UPI003634546F
MLDYAALRAVYMVLEEGTFERAALRLNVTPSAISHRVKALEERVGTPLVVRSSPCYATEAGRRLCRHIERVHLLEAKLQDDFPGLISQKTGGRKAKVRIVVNADSLSTWCMDAFADFTTKTGYLLDLVVEDQDFTLDWLTKGEADAAITSTSDAAVGCNVLPLGTLRYHATASPAFVSRYFPEGIDKECLAKAPSLTFNRKDSLQRRWIFKAFGQHVEHQTHWVPSSTAFIDAAIRGIGWGMNPEPLVAKHLASGTLMELVEGCHIDTLLYWQINRLSANLLSELTTCVARTAKAKLR